VPDAASDPKLIATMKDRVRVARDQMAAAIAAGRGDDAWEAALIAISARGRFGVRLGLERSRALLEELGNPEREVRGALIAGTNGKGSVGALISAALAAAGVRHGSTPKPHHVSYRERIRFDGRPLASLPFAVAVERALDAADRIESRVGPVTEFELLAGVVFDGFRTEGIDRAVVEIGLGGRLDAMHAWDGGVAVVTNVGLDHQEYLGETIKEIAGEKAAIILRGDRAVTGATDRGEALSVVKRVAQAVGAPLTLATYGSVRALGRDGIEVDLPRLGPVRIGLLGRHQGENAAVALATLDALKAAGIVSVSDEAIREGFGAARWPGRMELIRGAFGESDQRDLLLDGAHNEDGAAALASGISDLGPLLVDADGQAGRGEITMIVAAMADKSIDKIFRALARSPLLQRSRLICTSVGDDRSSPSEILAAAARAAGLGGQIETAADPRSAFDAATRSRGAVIVAGSLYLVGAVRERLLREGRLPDDGSLDRIAPTDSAESQG
jgi:dihydrofolate synthase/folylpolyglutamate synthase